MEKANIVPAHKKNSRQIMKNYRPISLLPICGKIFEKIIFDEIYEHLTANKLLSDKQSGFRPGDSAINQLLSVTHDIYNAFEHHHDTRAVFLDISKAFHKVWHEGLLLKLKSNGISGHLLNLLSWMNDTKELFWTVNPLIGTDHSWGSSRVSAGTSSFLNLYKWPSW